MQPDPDSYRGCNLNTMSQEIEERIERTRCCVILPII
jgi:hypothetical protein